MTANRRSIWTYPWDVQDLGLDVVTGELRERAALNCVSLATSYHAGRFLQPRSPRRVTYQPEDGTIYFRPDPARWAQSRMAPKVASVLERGDVLRALVQAREAGGLAVSAWTVCLHNTRLGTAYPDVATRSAFDEPYAYALCPSHPDARDYVCALVEDLTHSYRPDAVELETVGFMGFAHGLHHEKDGVGLTAAEDVLLSLCFCPACRARSARAGIDAEAAAATVRRLLRASFERAVPEPCAPDFLTRGVDGFAAWPELHAYLQWRSEPVMSLIAEIKARAHPASSIYVIDLSAGWLGGVETGRLRDACDGLILCGYDAGPAELARQTAEARRLLGPDRTLLTGLRVFHADVATPAALAANVAAAMSNGSQGTNFYNYGLIPASRLDWIGASSA
jgi:hypothetical protein